MSLILSQFVFPHNALEALLVPSDVSSESKDEEISFASHSFVEHLLFSLIISLSHNVSL